MSLPRWELAHLLDPVEVQTFTSTYWERESLYIPGEPDKFADLFSLDQFFRTTGMVDWGEGRGPSPLYSIKAGYEGSDGNHYEVFIHPGQSRRLLGAGLTIQAEHLERSDPLLGSLVRSLKEQIRIAAAIDIGGFLSPDCGGYVLHYDAPTMWVLQIAGAKRWWYSTRPVVPFPEFNRVPSAEERKQGVGGLYRESDLREQLLRTGDVLYLPAGTWHRVQAEGQSLHLCLTVRASNYVQLASSVLSPLLMSLADWRHLPAPAAIPGDLESMSPELQALFAERIVELRAAVEHLTPDDLYRAWRSRAQPT
jgi:ribosomal protein L16 Arg81 hydroxylase